MRKNHEPHHSRAGPLAQAAEKTSVARSKTGALFFGDTARPLFGLYGPPQGERDREHGILLCGPVGHEYMRTHWCLRLLGDHLIQAGFHVMRFDFSCMGDSWGDFEQATAAQWVEDIKTAFTELQDNAGVQQMSIVGLRLGATLAWAAATDLLIKHLVLWDPILEGRAYLTRLRAMQTQLRNTWRDAPPATPGAAHEELLGYRYPAALIEQISGLGIGAEGKVGAEHVSLVVSDDQAGYRSLRDGLELMNNVGAMKVCADAGSWDAVEEDLYAEPLLMPNTRRAIVELLGEVQC